MDDGYLEQRSVREHRPGEVTDERDVVNDSLGDPSAGVADHRGISELDSQEGSRVDARIEAGDQEHLLAGHERQPRVCASGGESAVALQERAKAGHAYLQWRAASAADGGPADSSSAGGNLAAVRLCGHRPQYVAWWTLSTIRRRRVSLACSCWHTPSRSPH